MRPLIFLCGLFVATAAAGQAAPGFSFHAGSETLWYDPANGTGLATVSLQIQEVVTNPGYPNALTGWSMALAHDGAFLTVDSFELGAHINALNGGTGPDFVGIMGLSNGFTIGVVYSFLLTSSCIYDVPREVVALTYRTNPLELLGDLDGEQVQLQWQAGLGSPPVANVVVLAGVGGVPGLVNGFVHLLPLTAGEVFIRGDSNNSGGISAIADGIWTLNYLFAGGTLACFDAADTNDDGSLNLIDAIDIFNWGFAAGPNPPPPFTACGIDPTADGFDCANSACP
ncbi:MAG: hypothetical protein AAF581_04560 [Planctomycetota bacterium]